MGNKLGVQYQEFDPEYHERTKPPVWKHIFLEGERPHRGVWESIINQTGGFPIGRMYFHRQDLSDPKGEAQRLFEYVYPAAVELKGLFRAWEYMNEKGHFGDEAKRLNESTMFFAELMHRYDLPVMCGNWGTGNPHGFCSEPYEESPERWLEGLRQHWAMYHGMMRECEYLGLHEYSAPEMWSQHPFQCGRHTLAHEVWPDDLQKRKNWVIITECGIDTGIIETFLAGWKHYNYTEEQYLKQLKWYEEEYLLPFYWILGATLFLAVARDKKWESFEVRNCRQISDYISTRKETPMDDKQVLTAWINDSLQDPWTWEVFEGADCPARQKMEQEFGLYLYKTHRSSVNPPDRLTMIKYGWIYKEEKPDNYLDLHNRLAIVEQFIIDSSELHKRYADRINGDGL